MLRPRWYKVLADLWGNKVRSTLVIASIAVGLFAVGTIATIDVVLGQDMRASYTNVNPANIQLTIQPFQQELVESVRHMQHVADAVGARTFSLRVRSGPNEWTQVNLIAVPDFDEYTINRVHLERGVWPPQDHEIVFDHNKLGKVNTDLGQTVEIELPSGKTRQMKVVGIVKDETVGSNGGAGGFFQAPPQAYVTFETLKWLEQPGSLNLMYVTVDGDRTDLDYIRWVSNRISKRADQYGHATLFTVVRRSTDHPNVTYIDAIGGILLMLGLMVVFLSTFLITNTLSALLNQQVQQIGVMKTIGARSQQIVQVYMTLILVYSLLALAISLPLAHRAAYWALASLATKMNFTLQGQHPVPASYLLQIFIALVVPQAAAIMPILRGARVSVQEALNGVSVSAGMDMKDWLGRMVNRVRGISRPLRISLRNTFRRKSRLVLTLVTLTLGGAIFISIFNVRSSLSNYTDKLSKYFAADVNLSLDRPQRVEEVEQLLAQHKGVVQIEGWAGTLAVLLDKDDQPGESVRVMAPPADSRLIEPMVTKGRWILPGDQNAITLSELFLSQYPDLKVGDRLRLKINGKKTEWVVVGFFQFAGKSSGFIAYTDYDSLVRITGQSGRAANYQIITSNTRTLDEQKAAASHLQGLLTETGYYLTDIRAGKSLKQSAADGFDTMIGFLLFMAMLAALVGSIGLMGTMSMNVLERTREIGVMRAIGASDRIVMKMVVAEGLIIGMISWLFGVLLSIPISEALSAIMTRALFDARTDMVYTAEGFLIWLGLVLVLSLLSSILPARSAASLTIREVLAYE